MEGVDGIDDFDVTGFLKIGKNWAVLANVCDCDPYVFLHDLVYKIEVRGVLLIFREIAFHSIYSGLGLLKQYGEIAHFRYVACTFHSSADLTAKNHDELLTRQLRCEFKGAEHVDVLYVTSELGWYRAGERVWESHREHGWRADVWRK